MEWKNRRSSSSAGSSSKRSKKVFHNTYTNRNAWFKFDKDGVMEIGWVHENGTDYHLSGISDGSLGEWIKK
jgi:hypothetical protein